MSLGPLPGFRDFYPADLADRAHIMQAWRAVARRYAFVEYDGPPLEPLDLYTRKSGEEIVGQLYSFTDKGGREVALRPEMTPTFARMVAARANALRKPVRWFSMPQLFRYERQQKGRLREHFQLNVDIVGEPDVTADAELLAVAIDIMRELGLSRDDVVARVSDRRVLSAYLLARGVPEESLAGTFAVIDKLDRQSEQATEDALAKLHVPRSAYPKILEISRTSIEDVSTALQSWADRHHVDDFLRYLRYVSALLGGDAADWVRLDLSVVRGLAYYTGIVFELFDKRSEFRAICGGGRYDNLLHALGGVDLPALGFGMGDVVLGELLRARGLLAGSAASPDWWVASAEEDLVPEVMEVAAALRSLGESVEYSLRVQSLSRQLKTASTIGVARTVIVGPEFRDSRVVVLKPMERGALEERITLESLLSTVRDFRARERSAPTLPASLQ
jgi:histidyl-tRNA synthetase